MHFSKEWTVTIRFFFPIITPRKVRNLADKDLSMIENRLDHTFPINYCFKKRKSKKSFYKTKNSVDSR